MRDLDAINRFLQEQLLSRGLETVTAVEAAQWLDTAGLLRDSPGRPGKPLRDLLRKERILGQRFIRGARQKWFIDRVRTHRRRPQRPALLPSLLRAVEISLTVADIASRNLWFAPVRKRADLVADHMEDLTFDVAPMREKPVRRYVLQAELRGQRVPTERLGRSIDPVHMVTSTLGLADGVKLLRNQPFYFVLEGHRLAGIVTDSDLQKPAVSMVTLGLVLASEVEMNRLIVGWLGDQWFEDLPLGRRNQARKTYGLRRKADTEISLLECLMLTDRLLLVGSEPRLRAELGFDSGTDFNAWAKTLKNTRNLLAHGETILDVLPEPAKAVERIQRVRNFAEGLATIPSSP